MLCAVRFWLRPVVTNQLKVLGMCERIDDFEVKRPLGPDNQEPEGKNSKPYRPWKQATSRRQTDPTKMCTNWGSNTKNGASSFVCVTELSREVSNASAVCVLVMAIYPVCAVLDTLCNKHGAERWSKKQH